FALPGRSLRACLAGPRRGEGAAPRIAPRVPARAPLRFDRALRACARVPGRCGRAGPRPARQRLSVRHGQPRLRRAGRGPGRPAGGARHRPRRPRRPVAAAAFLIAMSDLTSLRAMRLTRTLQAVAAAHPFYRARFAQWGIEPGRIRTPDDLAMLPPTRKDDYIA